mmetsp:Transcript_8146/g.30170  ORF Transcript_8146/g.30170 Transcript_8146/m.30170 type:complete len:313 (+) Transcript_8146:2849-3787(+)
MLCDDSQNVALRLPCKVDNLLGDFHVVHREFLACCTENEKVCCINLDEGSAFANLLFSVNLHGQECSILAPQHLYAFHSNNGDWASQNLSLWEAHESDVCVSTVSVQSPISNDCSSVHHCWAKLKVLQVVDLDFLFVEKERLGGVNTDLVGSFLLACKVLLIWRPSNEWESVGLLVRNGEFGRRSLETYIPNDDIVLLSIVDSNHVGLLRRELNNLGLEMLESRLFGEVIATPECEALFVLCDEVGAIWRPSNVSFGPILTLVHTISLLCQIIPQNLDSVFDLYSKLIIKEIFEPILQLWLLFEIGEFLVVL